MLLPGTVVTGSMKLYLLTHTREIAKKTNTGRLVIEAYPGQCERIVWERVNPDPRLQQLASDPRCALLYPASEFPEDYADPVAVGDIDTFVLLDATWQQARKMYNQSPYLQAMTKVSLDQVPDSQFTLRRNQRPGGLCTVECVIEILRRKQCASQAAQLQQAFLSFSQALA